MAAGFLHKVGVYFGVAEPNEEERREGREADERALARPLWTAVLGAYLAAVPAGAVFGLGMALGDESRFDVPAAIVFWALMGSVWVWRMLQARRRARDRLGQRSP
jgi:hypothetical protein